MNTMLSANAVSAKYSAMSKSDKELVTSLIANIEHREEPRKISLLGILGAISMSLPDLVKPQNDTSEEEIDEFVYSVRKERYATRNRN